MTPLIFAIFLLSTDIIVEFGHGLCLDIVDDVDVGLHGLGNIIQLDGQFRPPLNASRCK